MIIQTVPHFLSDRARIVRHLVVVYDRLASRPEMILIDRLKGAGLLNY